MARDFLPSEPTPVPEEEVAYRDRLAQVVEEKRQALLDPGPPWKEWFLYSGAKWWMGLLFLIVDIWILVGGIETGGPATILGIAPWVPYLAGTVAAVGLEYLAWHYLWYRPEGSGQKYAPFVRTWYRLVPYGRWTPEYALAKAGRYVVGDPTSPNPKEFA